MSDTKTSGFAITSLILGIMSLFIGLIPFIGLIISLLAIIFGILGLRSIKNPQITGKGLAMTGLIMGCIVFVFSILLITIGALAYFGMLNPTRFLPDKCMFSSGIGCLEVTSDGNSILVVINNQYGQDVVINDIIINTDGTCIEPTIVYETLFPNNSQQVIEISCKEIIGERVGFTLSLVTDTGMFNGDIHIRMP